jgi:hypothetical protein
MSCGLSRQFARGRVYGWLVRNETGGEQKMASKEELETKLIEVGYTHPASESDEVANLVKKMARNGWRLVGRKNSEGLLGIGSKTTLHFARPTRIGGTLTQNIKFEVETVYTGYNRPSDVGILMDYTIRQRTRKGWILAARTNHEGFLGFGYSCLTFMKPKL